MVTALEYRHVPTGTLAVLAQRLGEVWASPSTWYRLAAQVDELIHTGVLRRLQSRLWELSGSVVPQRRRGRPA